MSAASEKIMARHRKVRAEYAGLADSAGFHRRFALCRRMVNLRAAAGDPTWLPNPGPPIMIAKGGVP